MKAAVISLFLIVSLIAVIRSDGATHIDIIGPPGSSVFGALVKTLPNGNIIVTDPGFDMDSAANIGAVYLYDGKTGDLISILTGSTAGDQVGSVGVMVLPNGSYVVLSRFWDSASAADVGAATFCTGAMGCAGVVSAANSLIGTNSEDTVGSLGVTVLSNGNYLVRSNNWDHGSAVDAGAVTWCDGSLGCRGVVSPANSLVGTSLNDRVGQVVVPISNGNYVSVTQSWDNGAIQNVGAATFCEGAVGCRGLISATNSLIGTTAGDGVANWIGSLSNGDYVVQSPNWDNGSAVNAGAATYCSGVSGCSGFITPSNSLVGTASNDNIGGGAPALALPDGRYVIASPNWDNGTVENVGAVTFCGQSLGCTGPVTVDNSLVGTTANDNVGAVFPPAVLSNGNYVVGSQNWDNGSAANAGAATFCSGVTGCVGSVSPSNSLVGTKANDNVGARRFPLVNGNYLVISGNWDNGSVVNAGAVTFCDGNVGCAGAVSTTNSLHGTTAGDLVGGTAAALPGGRYVVGSELVDIGSVIDAGASTFCGNPLGCTGPVTAANSVVGTKNSDQIGLSGHYALARGDYAIISPFWGDGAARNVGAITICGGSSGCSGTISPANSLIGSTASDQLGTGASRITVLSNGDMLVHNEVWDNAGIVDAGSVSYVNGELGTFGRVSAQNSVLGTTAGAGSLLSYEYDYTNRQLVVGRRGDNKVTLFRPFGSGHVSFDYDGDRKSDLTVRRPTNNIWYLLLSGGAFTAIEWGVGGDRIAPADYDGDGKTDIAVFRPSNGAWYIFMSQSQTFRSFSWGADGDLPVPTDRDLDGRSDLVIYRPANNTWYANSTVTGPLSATAFGASGDNPLVGDFDGDGHGDDAVFRRSNGTWYLLKSAGGFTAVTWGQPGDVPVPADYDGDGAADIAVFRPGTGQWFLNRSTAGFATVNWGQNGDVPVAADYDGDGKSDPAVFRPSEGNWYMNRSSAGFLVLPFGQAGDVPTPSAFIYQE